MQFGVFLLYPTITATLFRVLQCRELGSHKFHEEDYNLLCDSSKYYLVYVLSMLLIVAFPIGVPAIFLFLMHKRKQQLGGVNTTVLGGAKLASDEVEDEDDPFGYLCCDMKPEFWYYEIGEANERQHLHLPFFAFVLASHRFAPLQLKARIAGSDLWPQVVVGWPVSLSRCVRTLLHPTIPL